MQPDVCGAKWGTPHPADAPLRSTYSLLPLSRWICPPLRSQPPIRLLSVFLLVVVWVGCSSIPSLDSAPDPQQSVALDVAPAREFSARVASFSVDRAWRDLVAITEVGPRPAGSRGNARARDYLRAELEELGVEVESWDVDYVDATGEAPSEGARETRVTNLSAVISGSQSQDRFLLVAPFDSRAYDDFEFIGANDGASGAAVVLEIARAIAADPLPFATEIVFLDGESVFRSPNGEGAFYAEIGSLGLASRIQNAGTAGFRVMVYLNRVGDADLRIARDLMSHRIYREEFWRAAAALDQGQAFPSAATYENAGVGHRYFLQIGLREIVSIVDTSFGGDQPPGLYAGTEQDTIERCSPDSLETVGVVVLEALDAISARLSKIDRFVGSRTTEGDLQ
jgi:hypothetical protein